MNFKLKHVSGVMHKHGMITTINESDCKNGMDAMIDAWNYYKEPESTELQRKMDCVILYNEFDCRVLEDISNYLDKNLC